MKPIIIYPDRQKKEEPRQLRVCSYSRVSRKTEDANRSLLNQIQYWTRVIDNKQNWIYVESYWDEGISGKSTDKRDDFNRMLSDCRKGKIDLIVTKSVARFARNVADSLQTVRELKQIGVNIIFEENNIDTRKMDSEMKLSIFPTFAQQEVISFSENMRWSVDKRMKAGEYSNGIAPFGYKYINGKLEIVEEQSKIVQKIFNDYINGKGTIYIARELREAGIKKADGTTEWNQKSIGCILRNIKYTGDSILRKKR